MRNLTIQRTKSFVASLVKVKVYIEDYNNFDAEISNTPCRYLGDLKNGETKTFSVGEEAAKVFVIIDQLSKNICNEYYNLPAGTEDVTLTGQNRYNPANGNAFRFDGVTDEDVLKNRKKGNKKGIIILIAAALVGVVIGLVSVLDFGAMLSGPETFTTEEFSITLTSQFEAFEAGEYNACYEIDQVMVMFMKESFADNSTLSYLSLEQYGQALIQSYEGSAGAVLNTQDGEPYSFTYTETIDGEECTYVTYVFKTDDAFWYVDFVTFSEYSAKYSDEIQEWAKSIVFN